MLREVQKINGDEHGFLLGFYYRQCGRLNDALERLSPIVDAKYVGNRCKREIVQVYLQLEEYEQALEYARNNYEENRGNQFHTQAYFYCLINSSERDANKDTLNELIRNLRGIDSDQSKEMADICQALYTARIDHNMARAIDLINDCIARTSGNHYPLLTKCDIALKFRDKDILSEAVTELKGLSKKRHVSQRTLSKYEAYLLALEGHEEAAIAAIQKEIDRFPEESKRRVIDRIKGLVPNS